MSANSTLMTSSPLSQVVNLIDAIGSTPSLSYHKEKTATSAVLLPISGSAGGVGGACVCAHQPLPFGQGKGWVTTCTPVHRAACVVSRGRWWGASHSLFLSPPLPHTHTRSRVRLVLFCITRMRVFTVGVIVGPSCTRQSKATKAREGSRPS